MPWEPNYKKLTQWARCGLSLCSTTPALSGSGPLWILEATSTTFESTIPNLLQTTCKAICFTCGPGQKALQLVPDALPLSLTTWQFQRCPKYLRQISWVMKPLSNTNGRVTEWPPRNREQSQALFQHNHSRFEKEQPACYWAPVETACLSRGHWVTMQSGQPIMNTKP